jgi:hypothetical protein
MNPIDAIHTDVNIAIVHKKKPFLRFQGLLNGTHSRRIYSQIAAWVTVLHLLGVVASGTTIIAMRFDEAVVIVTDSKALNLTTGKSTSVAKFTQGEKLLGPYLDLFGTTLATTTSMQPLPA